MTTGKKFNNGDGKNKDESRRVNRRRITTHRDTQLQNLWSVHLGPRTQQVSTRHSWPPCPPTARRTMTETEHDRTGATRTPARVTRGRDTSNMGSDEPLTANLPICHSPFPGNANIAPRCHNALAELTTTKHCILGTPLQSESTHIQLRCVCSEHLYNSVLTQPRVGWTLQLLGSSLYLPDTRVTPFPKGSVGQAPGTRYG